MTFYSADPKFSSWKITKYGDFFIVNIQSKTLFLAAVPIEAGASQLRARPCPPGTPPMPVCFVFVRAYMFGFASKLSLFFSAAVYAIFFPGTLPVYLL